MSKFAPTLLFLSLILFFTIVLIFVCKRLLPARPSARSIDALVIDYLSRKYEQPENGAWEDYKAYFLPDEPGLNLLVNGTDLDGLRIYRASVWRLHWVPEEFPILVWTVSRPSGLQMGVLEGPEQIKTIFPSALKGIIFQSPGPRKGLAFLLGEMVTVFESDRWKGRLAVETEGNCEWVERSGPSPEERHRLVSACFSDKGVLERIVLPVPSGR